MNQPSYLKNLGVLGYDEQPEDLVISIDRLTAAAHEAMEYLLMVSSYASTTEDIDNAIDLIKEDFRHFFDHGDNGQGSMPDAVAELIGLTQKLEYGDR